MQEAKKMANRILAEKMIEKLKLRRMEGFYVETKEEALALVKENFLTQGKSVCYGAVSYTHLDVYKRQLWWCR